MASSDFDDLLKDVARLVVKEEDIDKLGKCLKFDKADIQRFLASNLRFGNLTYNGTLDMLRTWNQRVRKADERPTLKAALLKAGLHNVASTVFPEAEGNSSPPSYNLITCT